jgi:diguanylate cyclase (GGDEF)-like protein/PAS domain S-box-containing protein
MKQMPGTEPGTTVVSATAGREPAVEARALAYLFAAGAGLGALALALPHSARQDDLGVAVVIAIACVGAVTLVVGASRIPSWGGQVFVALGTLMISAAILFADAGDSPYAFLYVWVGIYAFYFFPRAWAIAHSAFVALVYGGLLTLADLPSEAPAARWLLTIGTLVVAGALIDRLGERVRERAAEADRRAEGLRDEKARGRAIIDTATEAFIAMDARGRIIDWNPAAEQTFGWARERAIGSSVIDLLVPARYRAEWQRALSDVVVRGDSSSLDRRLILQALHREGREMTCEAAIAAIAHEGQTTFNAFIHDITDRATAEEEVRARAEDMAVVARVARDLASVTDAHAARAAICEAALDVADSKVAILYEPDPHGRELVSTLIVGAHLAPIRLPFTGQRSGAAVAFSSGQPFFVADAVGHPTVSQKQVKDLDVVSALWQPVLRNDVPIGVLTVAWGQRVEELSERLSSLMGLLAAEAAVAIERADLLTRLEAVARTDDLTGLANRRAWDEHLPRELARAKREGRPMCVAMIDLDRFKGYNDEHGHQAGDRLLKQLAATWRDVLRPTDVLARYGGEEFVVLLPNCELERAVEVIERLRSIIPEDETCSAGVACWDGAEAAESLVNRADDALYRAKREGRDRVVSAV